MNNMNRLIIIALCAALFSSTGCGPKQPAAPSKTDAKPGEGPVLSPPDKPKTSSTESTSADEQAAAAKIQASFASLTTEDRALAEKQKICPVSGGPLGEMGPPKKLNVAGHEVFICCEGCEKPLTSEPEKYLAKINLQPVK